MLRNDGKYEIFVIEFRSTGTCSWHRISFDVAWVPAEQYQVKKDIWHEFSASGKCWQETGVHGTYDAETALVLFNMLKQHSIKKDKYSFRVAKITIQQDSEVWCG